MTPALTVVYRDDRLVAIDKPAGLLVHRSDLDRHETRFALQLLRDQIGQPVWPVHRLDKGTSGILLFALDPAAAAVLGSQFERGEVAKRYLAVVRGHPDEAGEIDHPLGRMADEYGYRGDNDIPQAAVTRYRRLATVELPYRVDRYPSSRYALMELTPLTGRRHQLRRHMKHIAHPIVGDATHGKGRHNRLFQDKFGCHRLLLASVSLGFRHPGDGRPVVLSAPPGADFADCIRQLGWTDHL
ncbi:MAG: pseudouridine synthase [Gallionellaceae bacterium]|nr:pseudouridine synthase [Gallionellaceae bacterium]